MTEIPKIIGNLSVQEKAYLISGRSFWETNGISQFDLSPIIVSDGPHGLRRAVDTSDSTGSSKSIKAVCFPTASAQACSFDEDLLFQLGELLGIECQAENIQVLLGPANNIKRTPLCGRNFEYYSEDPYLAGKLSAALIKGIQSKGIGTSLKHFVANNQEKSRMTINEIIDERTLREIYLTAFEIPILEAEPWTIMTSYNRINGSYACQNNYLLTDVIRSEWKFKGLIMSDWGAVDQLPESLSAGLDLEMPTSGKVGPENVIRAIKKGRLSSTKLDEATKHVIELIQRANDNKNSNIVYSLDEHHNKAREIGRECIVLLKNEGAILPISKNKYKNVTVIGDFAIHPRFQGGGSSHINAYKVDTLLDQFQKQSNTFNVQFARGYDANKDEVDEKFVLEAIEKVKNTEITIVSLGLPDRYETEGIDRMHLNLPPNQLALISKLTEITNNIIVVLSIGSCVKVPFASKIKGLVCNWLLGEAGAGATFDILTGMYNPCGKLAESFIKLEQDDPSCGNYPGNEEVEYKEGVMVGYRFHDYYNKEVEFEFGFGLSYSSFEYLNLRVSKEKINENENLSVSLIVKNTGSMIGKEIVQLYVSEKDPFVSRPPKELKAFRKVLLKPGEEKIVEFNLTRRSFAYYNTQLKNWDIKSGTFRILIGKSSRNIVLEKEIEISSLNDKKYMQKPELVYEKRIYLKKSKKITRNTKMGDLQHHVIGSSIYKAMEKEMKKSFQSDDVSKDEQVLGELSMQEFLNNIPLRGLVALSQGKGLSESRMNQLIFILNRTRRDTILGKILGVFKKV